MEVPNRRDDTEVVLATPVTASVAFAVGDVEVELDVLVTAVSHHTVRVALASGAGTLALATSATCELLLTISDLALAVRARPGRRRDDVHGRQELELVVLDDLPGLPAMLATTRGS